MQEWPISILLVVALNFVGWSMKRAGFIPNKLIPSVLMGLGSLIYVLIGDTGSIGPQVRNPSVILALYGLLLGVMAWLAHGLVWKQIEKRFPQIQNGDTETIEKPK